MDAIKGMCALAVAAWAAWSPCSNAQPSVDERFVEIGHSVDYFGSAAASLFAKADVDADGIADVTFIGRASGNVLFVLGRRPAGTLGIKQATLLPANEDIVRVLAWSTGSVTNVVTVATSGSVRIYSGIPLAEQRSFVVATNAVSAAIGDVDGDGSADLVLLTAANLHTYSLASGLLVRSLPVSGNTDLALAQLDADPALEVILAGALPGLVVDGATHATDWTYIDGFGARVAAGKFSAEAQQQWVAASPWYQFTTFRATPWSPLWTGKTSHDISALATADLQGAGRDDILVGDGQWGKVHVYDSNTHQQRFEVSHDGHGVGAIVAADLGGDGPAEIVFASGGSSFSDKAITVANGQSGESLWSLQVTRTPYLTTAIGDVDGDGRLELVAAGALDTWATTFAIFDLETGDEEWRALPQGNAGDPFFMGVKRIALLPLSGGGMSIVFAGTSISDGRISVMNGVTKAVSLQIGFYASGPMRSREIRGLQVLDYNSDGVSDYAVAISAANSGASGSQLRVFSGVDGTQLWSSVTMGSGFSQINDVLLVDAPAGGRQLGAVMPDSLRAYSVQSGLLHWTMPVGNVGAAYIQNGQSGAEIATYNDSGVVSIYSVASQALLRSFTLSSGPRALAVAGGDVQQLVFALDGTLALVDGIDGRVRASSDYLGVSALFVPPPSLYPQDADTWLVGYGSNDALFRLRLELTDRIFASSFDGDE